MLEVPADQHRRLLVESPSEIAGHEGIVTDLQQRNPDAAIRAAARTCAIAPDNHRWRS